MITLPDLEVLRQLGAGSVARVFLAREPALKRLVAIKVLREDLAADDVARLRFEREAQAAACITHPNVTSVHRVGHLENGIPFIVMEYVDGRTLEDVVAANGPVSANEVKRIVTSVAHALHAAHHKGVIHRDVRPANVIWEAETDRIVLMDFGIAALLETGSQAASRLTYTGQIMGDPLHMSPEQLEGSRVTQHSDIYCLGVLAYELLTGHVPAKETGALSEAMRDVDTRLRDVIQRCLSPNPQHRPSAKDVADSLLQARDPLPAALSPLQEFIREVQRRKVTRVGLAYAAAAFVVLQAAQLVLPGLPADDADQWYQSILFITLAGFPVALVLSWLFDWTASGVRRARAPASTRKRLLLPLLALTVSSGIALVLWLVLTR